MKSKKNLIKNRKMIIIISCIICIAVIIFNRCGILLQQISVKRQLSMIKNNDNIIRIADKSTVNTYNDIMTQNGRISGRYKGRVWTDKSVYSYNETNGKVKLDGDKFNVEFNNEDKNEDFLTVFSALGSSQAVNGKLVYPVDVMMIIDVSSSMGSADVSTSSMSKVMQAADNAIKKLMESNKNARVGIVLFDDNAFVLAPLKHYEPPVEGTQIDENNAEGGDNVQIEYTYIKAEGPQHDCTITFKYKDDDGTTQEYVQKTADGTNLQGGYYVGMKMLENADNLDVMINGEQYRRMPSVILFSDGEPTYGSDYSTWWEPSMLLDTEDTSQNDNWQSRQNQSEELRIMKPLMTVSYMKKAVERHYNEETSIYTVGLGLREIRSKLALNPNEYLVENPENIETISGEDTKVIKNIYNMWIDYKNGNSPRYFERFYSSSDGHETLADDYRFYHPWQEEAYLDRHVNRYFDRGVGDEREPYLDNPYGEPFKGDLYTKYTVANTVTHSNIEGHTESDRNGATPGINQEKYKNKEYDIKTLNYVNKYFDVNTDDVGTVFDSIINEVTIENFRPVDGGVNDAGDNNAVSYVDPIGKYMEVKDVKKLMLFGEEYNLKKDRVETQNINDQVVTRQYYRAIDESGNDKTIRNPNYIKNSSFSLSDIEIYVEKSNEYDTGEDKKIDTTFDEALHISVPSKALPIQLDTISLDEQNHVESFVSATGDAVLPIRIAYTIGISDNIMMDGKVDLTKVSKEYLEANKVGNQLKSAEKDYVYFYSNYYSAENYDNDEINETTYGNAATTYAVSPENRFYVYQSNLPVYKKISGDDGKKEGELEETGGQVTLTDEVKDMAEIEQNGTYYIAIEYYDPILEEIGKQKGNEGKFVKYAVSRKGSELVQENESYVTYYDTETKEEVISKGDHTIVTTKVGGKRVTDLNQLITQKEENKTETATCVYIPTYSKENNTGTYNFVNYMGNNGRISIEDSLLRIAKKIDNNIPEEVKEYKDFKFKLYLEGAEGIKNVILTEWDGNDWKAKLDKVTVTTNNDGYILDTSGKQTQYWAGNTEEQRTVDADGMITVYSNQDKSGGNKISVYDGDGVTPRFKLTTLFKTKELVFNNTYQNNDATYGVTEFTLKANEAIYLDKLSVGAKYMVEEILTDGEEGFTFLEVKGTGNGETIDKSNKKISGEIHTGIIDEATFINTYKPISIKVTKIWDDRSDAKRKRPPSVKLILQSNGETVIDNTGKPAEIVLSNVYAVSNNNDKWEYTFENLAEVDKDGRQIQYSIKEEEVGEGDLFYYYRVIIDGNSTDGFTVTNKLSDVTAEKVSKIDNDTVKKGDIITYTITLTNSADNQKTVYVKDQIPKGTEFVNESIQVNPVQDTSKTYTLQDLTENGIQVTIGVNEKVTLTFEVKVTGDGLVNEDNILNVAEIKDGDNIKDTNIVRDEYKGSIMNATKTAKIVNSGDRGYAVEGDEIEYSIEVVNSGEAKGVANIKDSIPEGTAFVENSITVSPIQEGVTESYTLDDLTKKGINVTLAAGKTATITFRVKINNFNEDEGFEKTITNIANLDDEKEITSNSVTVKRAHIVAHKTSSISGSVQKGNVIEYKINAKNEGIIEGTAKIRDSIPNGTRFKEGSIRITPKDKAKKDTYIEQDLTTDGIEITLQPEESVEITFEVEVTGEGLKNGSKIVNTASVDEGGQISQTEAVEHKYATSKISSRKSTVIENESLGYAHEGETIKYEIDVTNEGDLDGIASVKDQIPEGTQFVEGSIKINDEPTSFTKKDLTEDGININVLPENWETTRKVKIMENPPVVEYLNTESSKEVGKIMGNIIRIYSTAEEETKVNDLFTSYDSNLIVYNNGIIGENRKEYKDGSHGRAVSYSIEFTIDCQEFAFYTSSHYFRIHADEGNGYEMNAYEGTHGGSASWYRVTFPSKKQRNVKIELDERFFGVIVHEDDTIQKINRKSNPKVLYLGDGMAYSSLIEGKGYVSYANTICNILGLENFNNSSDGIGYKSDDSGTRFNFLEKLEDMVPEIDPDIIVFQGGRQDLSRGFETTEITEGITECFDFVKNKYPSIKVIVLGFFPGNTIGNLSSYQTEMNTILKEKALEHGYPFIDLLTGETISGDGNIITKESEPYITEENVETYVSNRDLTREGHKYFGEKLAEEVYKILNNIDREEKSPVKLSFEVKVDPLGDKIYSKTISNVATVNEQSTNQEDVEIKKPNIEATKTSNLEDKSEVGTGTEITYSINVKNTGSEKKTFFVKDKIPIGTKFKEKSVKIRGKQDLNKNEQSLIDGIEITLKPGESAKIEFIVIVTGEGLLNEENLIINSAEVDGKITNEVTHKYCKMANINSEKRAVIEDEGKGYVNEGDTITYEIDITNNGDLEGIANIKDQIPDGTEFVEESIKINGQETELKEEDLTGDGININVLPESGEISRGIKIMNNPPVIECLNTESSTYVKDLMGNTIRIGSIADEETKVNDLFTSYDSNLIVYNKGIIGENRKEYKDGSHGRAVSYSIEFTIDCQEFAFYTSSHYFRIHADEGNGYEMNAYEGTHGVSASWYRVTFPSKKQRNVKIELDERFFGVIVHEDDTIQKLNRESNPKVLYLGDGMTYSSLIERNGYMSYANTICNILGLENFNSSSDGIGYKSDDNGTKYNFLEKLNDMVPKINPDIIIFQGGRQDGSRGFGTTAITEGITQCFDFVKNNYPNIKVIVLGFYSGVTVEETSSFQTGINTVLKEKALEHGYPFIDLLTGETISGDGNIITKENEPYITEDNIGTYISNKDLTPEGHRYFGEKLAEEVYKILNNIDREEKSSVKLSFQVRVKPLEQGVYSKTIENTAVVNDEETNTVTTEVKKPHIVTTKKATLENQEVKYGQKLTYTIELDNTTGTAEGIVLVKDELPKGVSFVGTELSIINDGEKHTYQIEDFKSKGIKVTLQAGKKAEIKFDVMVTGEGIENGQEIVNTATVDEVQTNEVKHTYVKEEPEIVSIIEKTANVEKINRKDEEITYNIKYEVTIDKYRGDVNLNLVDNLPYELDETKITTEKLNDGTYSTNSGKPTITWEQEIKGIDTYSSRDDNGNLVSTPYKTTIQKEITVSYKNIDVTQEKIENTVTGTVNLVNADKQDTVTEKEDVLQEYKVKLKVIKKWEDNGNRAGKRPEKITLQVYAGEKLQVSQDITNAQEQESNSNQWEYTFDNLPKYDNEGNEIKYTVNETGLENSQYKMTSVTTPQLQNTDEYEATITNTFEVPKDEIEIIINKQWVDFNNRAGKRPSSITVEAKGTGEFLNEEETEYERKTKTYTYVITGTEANQTAETWTVSVRVPKYDDKGNEIEYTIDEQELEGIFYEKTSVTNPLEKTEEGYKGTIENTFNVPETTTTVKVTKVWNDDDNANGIRPDRITVRLIGTGMMKEAEGSDTIIEGEIINKTQEINSTENVVEPNPPGNNWEYTFENLPLYDEYGNEIQYTVDEEIQGDEGNYYNKDIGGKIITNTFKSLNQGTVILTKKDTKDNSELKGAKFELQNQNNTIIKLMKLDGVYTYSEAGTETELETGEEGIIKIEGLPMGTYTLVEKKAPEGYVINGENTYEFTIDINNYKIEDEEIVNIPVEIEAQNDRIEISITKLDEKGENLQGAKLQLLSEDEILVKEWETTEEEYIISPIKAGKYKLKEVQSPEGYAIAEEMEIEVKEQAGIQEFKMVDVLEEVTLEITKVDAKSEETVLEGATFKLVKVISDGEGKWKEDSNFEEREATTNTDGKITFEKIRYGTYMLYETKAPDGYNILQEPIQVDINSTTLKDGKIVKVTIENIAKISLPETGSIGIGVFVISGMILMMIGMYKNNKKIS